MLPQPEKKKKVLTNVRFTDFLVYEVDLDGRVIHLKSLEKPVSAKEDASETTIPDVSSSTVPDDDIKMDGTGNETELSVQESTKKEEKLSSVSNDKADSLKVSSDGSWHEHFDAVLSPFLSQEAILQVRNMYLEGREPPRVSDTGWAGRSALSGEAVSEATLIVPEKEGNSRGGSRGKRGGRGGRGGRGPSRVDHRKVLSNVNLMSRLEFLMCSLNFELSSLSLPRKLVRRSIKSSANCLAENLTLRLIRLLPRLMKALELLSSGEDKEADGQVEGVIPVSVP